MLGLSRTLWRVVILVLAACAALAEAEETIMTQYEEDFSIFCNPEQGFYEYTDLNRLPEDIGHLREQGRTLIWGRINLESHRHTETLPEALLTQINDGFGIARQQGMKVIVRVSYGSKGAGGDYRTYLNRAYHPDVLKKWKTQGCFDEIQRRLGARLVLQKSCITKTVPIGGASPLSC